MGQLGANAAGPFMYLLPVFTAVLSVVFLGEALQACRLAGTGLIFLGVCLASRWRARARARRRYRICRTPSIRPCGAGGADVTSALSSRSLAFSTAAFSGPTRTRNFCPAESASSCGSANT